MADWTKQVSTTVTVPAGTLDKRITTYYADAAATPPNHMRILITGTDSDGKPFSYDSAVDDLTISPDQKAMLVGAGEAALAQMLAREGFSA